MKKIILGMAVMVAVLFGGNLEDGGKSYTNGDYKKAASFWEIAANNGDIDAQVNLAMLYLRGQGVKKDYKKAAELYTKAADQGHSQAQYNLARMYEQGDGVKSNYSKAMVLYMQSAEQGNVNAQYSLGNRMLKSSTREGRTYAYKYWKMAAKQGHTDAKYNLEQLCAKFPSDCKE